MRIRFGAIATAVGLIAATSAQAAHHLWDFTEIFSNASGSVQYVEMFCTAAGEDQLGLYSITTGTHTLNFVTNLPSSATANKWLLVATSNFAGVSGGIPPDYIVPANFFPTGGGTLNYAGIKIWNYGAVPTDGTHALKRDGTTVVNSPTNFAGQSGSVNTNTPVPMVQTWGLLLLVGLLLLATSGILRRREATAA
jgi:hypothetical protein